MKASTFVEARKAFVLKPGEVGTPVAQICRKAGISKSRDVGRDPAAICPKAPVTVNKFVTLFDPDRPGTRPIWAPHGRASRQQPHRGSRIAHRRVSRDGVARSQKPKVARRQFA